MINKHDNLALRANFVASVDTFAFLAKKCDMKPLLFPKHRKMCLFLFWKKEESRIFDEEIKEKRFFSQNENFLTSYKQELI